MTKHLTKFVITGTENAVFTGFNTQLIREPGEGLQSGTCVTYLLLIRMNLTNLTQYLRLCILFGLSQKKLVRSVQCSSMTNLGSGKQLKSHVNAKWVTDQAVPHSCWHTRLNLFCRLHWYRYGQQWIFRIVEISLWRGI